VTGNETEFLEGDWVKPLFSGRKMTIVKLEGTGAICSWKLGSDEQIAWIDFACLRWCGREEPEAALSEGKMRLSGNQLAR
jgi:hypothetical protein